MNIPQVLVTTRIKEVAFTNFRNIENGTISLPNTKFEEFAAFEPSIVGLYGQNGSGKSSVIMALGILKDLLSGNSISKRYSSCIRIGADRANLRFSVSCLLFKVINKDNGSQDYDDTPFCETRYHYSFDITNNSKKDSLIVENEIIQAETFDSSGQKKGRKTTIFDTQRKKTFIPQNLSWLLLTDFNDDDLIEEIKMIRAETRIQSRSFLFSDELTQFINEQYNFNKELFDDVGNGKDIEKDTEKYLNDLVKIILQSGNNAEIKENLSLYVTQQQSNNEFAIICLVFETLLDPINILRQFAIKFLHIIDTSNVGDATQNQNLPLLIWAVDNNGINNYSYTFNYKEPNYISDENYLLFRQTVEKISNVINSIIPEMRLSFEDLGIGCNSKNEKIHYFDIKSIRNGITLPIQYESDGIRRIVSILSLLIAAYNIPTFCVAIDEIDSGIFEYLLGEILSVMSSSMKGQLIFTSHNLRALEVMPAKYLFFTTTDPKNRFTKLSKRGNSNLRDTYFKEIVLGHKKSQIYNATDTYRIEMALLKAGIGGEVNG